MSKPFKPLLKNGKVKVEFEISTKGLEGKELVAFETAYRLEGYKKGDDVGKTPGVIVAEHKDLKDKGQTIKVVKPGTPIEHSPKTGDNAHILLAVALMLLAAEVIYVLFRRRKAARADEDDDSEEIVE
jgi:LPXTG-motif cell wall-anchored protein